MKRIRSFAAILGAGALALTGCGSSNDSNNSTNSSSGTSANSTAAEADGPVTITVGASPTPHKLILDYVQENLAADAGINIEVVEYQDYVQPNVALNNGDIDANYFQHLPYLEAQEADENYDFEHGDGIHIEPYGIYSEKITDLKDLKDGATVVITNDPSNQARALQLLVDNDLIELKDVESPTIYDLASNPKNLQFKEADAPSVPKLLPDYDIGIVNGNYALQNGLEPSKDALYLEAGADNPYANILAWNATADDQTKAAVEKLDELLHSDEVAQYIKDTWPNGEVVPAF
ncbi:MAG: ABC transporter [Actinomycetaceae bacterium]|nr:ABC transporter [Actinomycetaceae bacterium]